MIGRDIGEIIGSSHKGVKIANYIDWGAEKIDVMIDFSTPESTLENIRHASKAGVSMVVGTTGLTASETDEIKGLSKKIACVLAPNMSVGINLLLKVLEQVALTIGDDYDIEIIEAHHRFKKDAPSGTALKMAEVIAKVLERDLAKEAVYARKGLIGERSKTEIGIQTVRAGDIVGEHTVFFACPGERLEFTHRASSRETFARGAVRAARWIYGKKPGLYTMHDVLDLSAKK
jgi:4-hydroxy-tetrahydrodipicolinate reductase